MHDFTADICTELLTVLSAGLVDDSPAVFGEGIWARGNAEGGGGGGHRDLEGVARRPVDVVGYGIRRDPQKT
ncbi:hypothetical protein, partial [Streptomyces sp. NPDC048272]|uniref:hypothetical protein n=1 Tax=Streptomyces sp. NPDC048272 TaxID=3154616 RepID=UPI00342CCADF